MLEADLAPVLTPAVTAPPTIALAINADSLTTWFPPAAASFLRQTGMQPLHLPAPHPAAGRLVEMASATVLDAPLYWNVVRLHAGADAVMPLRRVWNRLSCHGFHHDSVDRWPAPTRGRGWRTRSQSMHMILMVVDGTALMLGSLLAASLLTSSAWMIAEGVHRPWVALVLLVAVLAGMLASPMEQSLFVRMVTVFAAVGTAVLSVVVLDRSSVQGAGRKF